MGIQSYELFVEYKTKAYFTLLKLTLLQGCFSRFLNCTNGTKSGNTSQISDIQVYSEPYEIPKMESFLKIVNGPS